MRDAHSAVILEASRRLNAARTEEHCEGPRAEASRALAAARDADAARRDVGKRVHDVKSQLYECTETLRDALRQARETHPGEASAIENRWREEEHRATEARLAAEAPAPTTWHVLYSEGTAVNLLETGKLRIVGNPPKATGGQVAVRLLSSCVVADGTAFTPLSVVTMPLADATRAVENGLGQFVETLDTAGLKAAVVG